MRCDVPVAALSSIGAMLIALWLPSIATGQDDLAEQRARERMAGLKRNFAYELSQEQYHTALDIAREIHTLDPSRGIAAFNVARVYSRINDTDRALEWLEIAISDGFSMTTMLRDDTSLAPVSLRPEFLEIVDAAEANRLEQFEAIKLEFAQQDFFTHVPTNLRSGERVPLVVALHGSGADGLDFGDVWRTIANTQRLIVIAPNAPREVGSGYAWLFQDESAWIVQQAIQRTIDNHPVDPSRIILTGFAEGAVVAYEMVLDEPHMYVGAIPIAGHYSTELEPPADLPASEWPMLYFMVGEHDGLRKSSELVTEQLRTAGFRVRSVEFPQTGHHLPTDYEAQLTRAIEFLLER